LISKTFLVLAIAVAFVAGSIMTGTLAYASGDKNGKPFEAIWDAIHALETGLAEIELTPGPAGSDGATGATGPTGADGVTRNIANYHTTQGNPITLVAGEPIVQQSFTTTSDSAIIFLTGNVHYIAVGVNFLYVDVFVDGQKELTSLSSAQGPITLNEFNDFSWTGTVPSGTHTVEVKLGTKQGGTDSTLVCGIPEFPEYCQLNTLVID